MRCRRSNKKVDIVNQCGLLPTKNFSYKMRNGYLGTTYSIPSKVGRFSEPLRWSDTHIVIRGDISPIASPKMQKFLEDVSNNSENTKLEYSKHPMMHITYPRRVIKERCLNTKISLYEQTEYYFNKSFLNKSQKNDLSDEERKFSPKPPSGNKIESPRRNHNKRENTPNNSFLNHSPRHRTEGRIQNRKRETNFSEYFDNRRRISLYSIIERENTHVSNNPMDYIYFARRSNDNNYGENDQFTDGYENSFDESFEEVENNEKSENSDGQNDDNCSTIAYNPSHACLFDTQDCSTEEEGRGDEDDNHDFARRRDENNMSAGDYEVSSESGKNDLPDDEKKGDKVNDADLYLEKNNKENVIMSDNKENSIEYNNKENSIEYDNKENSIEGDNKENNIEDNNKENNIEDNNKENPIEGDNKENNIEYDNAIDSKESGNNNIADNANRSNEDSDNPYANTSSNKENEADFGISTDNPNYANDKKSDG